MQKADGELLSSMFFLRLPIELMHERHNVGGEHLDAVRRRVCSSDALNGKGGGGSRKVSMPTAERPTKRDLLDSEVCAGRVYERSR